VLLKRSALLRIRTSLLFTSFILTTLVRPKGLTNRSTGGFVSEKEFVLSARRIEQDSNFCIMQNFQKRKKANSNFCIMQKLYSYYISQALIQTSSRALPNGPWSHVCTSPGQTYTWTKSFNLGQPGASHLRHAN